MKRIFLIIAITVSFILTSIYINADPKTLSELEAERTRINNEVNKLNNEKVDLTNKKILKESDINRLNLEINKLNDEVKNIEVKLNQAENDYKLKREKFFSRVSAMYQNKEDIEMIVELVLKTDNLEKYLAKYQMFKFVANKDKEVFHNYEMAKKELMDNKKLYEDYLGLKKMNLNQDNLEAQNIQNQVNNLAKLQENANNNLAFINSLEAKMLTESINISYILSKITGGKYVGGQMRWPVPGYANISSPYGNRIHPIYGTLRFHSGIDVPAGYGAAIHAVNAGKIIEAEYKSGYGNTVVVDHGGGITTLYAHCSSINSTVGEGVEAGRTIAKVGSTGASTGNHLHFEVRVNGITKNPMDYVSN